MVINKATEKHLQRWIFVCLVITLCILSVTVSAEVTAAEGQSGAAKIARERLQTRITYSCTELPIGKVLMDLAEQAEIDIVKSPVVQGDVTVKLTDIPLEEALTNILAAHNYTYVATANMIRVLPIPEITAAREQLITRVYQVTYADANEVANALGNFVSDRGKVALNRGTSHIMVTDTESTIKGIDKFIEQIDVMTPQVLVEVRIYDITSNEGFELGAQWAAGRNAPLKTTEHTKTNIDTDFPTSLTETTTTVIGPSSNTFSEDRTDTTTSSETTTGNYRDADDGTGSFTTSGTSTTTEDGDSTATDSGRTDTGTRVTELPMGSFFDTEVQRYTTRRRKPFVGGSFDSISGGTLNFSLLNDAVDLQLALNILHKEVEAKLIANPRVLVLDNEVADFEIIREIPYRELRQVAREDPITYTEFKNVGVHLKVTPQVAGNGMIKLRIEPELGVLVGLNGLGAPTIDTRRLDTTALVRDGQTIVLGGLRQKKTTRDISKVPVLGDMPLLGGLFRSETEALVINELAVFITTSIVTKPQLTVTEARQFKATEFIVPEIKKTRLDSDIQPKTAVDENLTEITDLLDMLLEKMQQ